MRVGSDFSGVGAFNQALMRLGIEYDEVFACDMDKYARETFIHNYGEPKYYPKNVYDREIPKEPLDIYMTSPPCQAFSLAGKRLGKEDKRGILFFNSYEFIKENKPRYFIFENVKGLLSDDGGKTFQEWLNYLGGKSINGLPVLFPTNEAVPYHIYYKVLNSKKLNVPQNRERIFIIGIRDDHDNNFRWPKDEPLTNKLINVLEEEVLTKYMLSEKAIAKIKRSEANKKIDIQEVPDVSKCLRAGYYKTPFDCQYIKLESNLEKYYLSEKMTDWVLNTKFNQSKPINIFDDVSTTIIVGGDKQCFDTTPIQDQKKIRIKSATKKGYEEAREGDSINFSVPNSETRRGRVGKGVSQTIDTQCNQGVWIADFRTDEGLRIRKDNNSPCLTASMNEPNEKMSRGNCVPFVGQETNIRRLTPRECFRLMDFPDTFTWTCSDTQAYKQAGNSIVVKCLEKIIEKFNL